MKAEELRIGNLIYAGQVTELLGDLRRVIHVVGINRAKIMYSEDYETSGVFEMSWNAETFAPIPLTEEWLLKFGFDVRDRSVSLGVGGELPRYATKTVVDIGEYSKTKFTLWYSKKHGWTLDAHIRQPELSHFIQSVHHLQNLYYVLTGEELCLKRD